MSIASPQNREEFKKYIRTRLGEPVLEVNVADEQLDLARRKQMRATSELVRLYLE